MFQTIIFSKDIDICIKILSCVNSLIPCGLSGPSINPLSDMWDSAFKHIALSKESGGPFEKPMIYLVDKDTLSF